MKIAVIGAGAIGGTIAALLDAAGHVVQVTARGEQLAAINGAGLQLSGAFGEHTARIEAVELLSRVPELIFVTTKAQDAEAAIRANGSQFGGAPIVVVQNGLDSLPAARRAAPHSAIVGGLALYAASYLSPGKVAVTTAGTTWLGGDSGALTEAAHVLGAVMPVTVTHNFEGAQWSKLIVNHVNALPAITGLSVQEVIANRALRLVMTESMREAVRVARAAGVVFDSLQGVSNRSISALIRVPSAIGQILPLLMKRRMGTTPNPGSTLQSIRRGQPTEIDFLNGAIVRRGLALAVPTPVSTQIVAMVHEVERSAVFLSPAEVARRAGRSGSAGVGEHPARML